jgi:putative component of toxin-antitoxin plasmid stabilization module
MGTLMKKKHKLGLELHFQVDPSSVFTNYQHFLRDTRTTVATTYQQNVNEAQQGNFGVAKSLHMTNYDRRITPQ